MAATISERIIPSPPAGGYQAYVYRWTHLGDMKFYVGYHKVSKVGLDDGYQHSSTNDEFAQVFQDSSSEFKFEILKFGTVEECKNREGILLDRVDAKNNPQYYNKDNGSYKYEEPDIDRCLEFNAQLDDGVTFPITYGPIKDHKEMEPLQVRTQHIASLQDEIRDRINDARGSTDKCNPVLVFCKRAINDEDLRVDGNHTVYGAAAAKHATTIPEQLIPIDIAASFNEAELRFIANLRNARPEVVKAYISDADAIKYVHNNAEKGIPVDGDINRKALKAYRFSGNKINSLLEKAQKEIDDEEDEANGQVFIDYSRSPDNKSLFNRVKRLNATAGTCSIYMSSAKTSLERAIEMIFDNRQDGVTKCVVVVHHKSKKWADQWKKVDQPRWMNIIECMNMKDWDVEFVEMETHRSDGKVN